MNLRTKVFFLIAIVLTVFFSVTISFVTYNLTQDFVELEHQEAEKNLNRVKDALREKIDNLASTLGDWAQWDDSYQFIVDRNEEYAQSNLQDSAFDILHINFVLFFDEEKNVVFKKFVANGEMQPFPEKILEHFQKDIADDEITLSDVHKEISSIDPGKIIYATRPITTSDGSLPANGIIVFGYIFDADDVQELAQLTHLSLSYAPYTSDLEDGFSLARDNLSKEQPVFIPETKNTHTLSAYTIVMNADDHPTLIFRIDVQRDIYQKGQSSIFLFTLLFLVTGIFFCGGIFFLLGYFVLNKVEYLKNEIQSIHRDGDVKRKIILSGKDELSLLAEEINQTFQTIDEKETEMQIQNDALQKTKKAMLNILEDVELSEKKLREQTIELSKFKKIADFSFDHTIITDIDGVILYANASAEMMTGYSFEEMKGKTPSLWGKQMSKQFYQTFWKTLKDEKQSYSGEITNKRKNGEKYLASIRVTPIFDEKGNIQFFVGTERDITKERDAQLRIIHHATEMESANARIETQKERAESILRFLKSIGEGVFATDIEGRIIFMNESAEILVARTFQDVEGKKSHEIFSFIQESEGKKESIFIVKKALERRQTFVLSQNVFLMRGEKNIPVGGSCSLIRDVKNEIIGTIMVFRDITKLRELEQMKNSFLSVAAHQLRTPLGSMRWSMELLINGDLGKLSKDVKESVKQLYENSGRMIVLVNDLLDVSRIDGERGRELKESVNLIKLIDASIHSLKSEAGKRHVKIIFHHPDTVPSIIVPPKHLYEALENLVSNGIKYNKPEGTLTLALDVTPQSLVLTVIDTGIGIVKEDQPKIFSKFFRASNAVRKETEGSGLGLSVVKSYMEECQATIRFESEENVGTSFFIEFPLA